MPRKERAATWCEKGKHYTTEPMVTLIIRKSLNRKPRELWCVACWHKDLDNDSGGYTDRF